MFIEIFVYVGINGQMEVCSTYAEAAQYLNQLDAISFIQRKVILSNEFNTVVPEWDVEVTMTRTYKKMVKVKGISAGEVYKKAESIANCDGFNEHDFDEEKVETTHCLRLES